MTINEGKRRQLQESRNLRSARSRLISEVEHRKGVASVWGSVEDLGHIVENRTSSNNPAHLNNNRNKLLLYSTFQNKVTKCFRRQNKK